MKATLSYTTWRKIAIMVAIENGEVGRKLFHKISKSLSKKLYKKSTTDIMYSYVLKII